jgi:hypothetical protein
LSSRKLYDSLALNLPSYTPYDQYVVGLVDAFCNELQKLPDVAPIDLASSILFTAITIFLIRGLGMMDIAAVQQYVNGSMTTLSGLIESGKYTENTFVKELMSNTLIDWNFFNASLAKDTDLNRILFNFFNDIQNVSHTKNNFEELCQILPDYTEELEVFELLACNLDGSYFHNLGAPDFKLYYPEPFIASPSFVHEEV